MSWARIKEKESKLAAAVEMYLSGWGTPYISEQLGGSPSSKTLDRYFKKLGIGRTRRESAILKGKRQDHPFKRPDIREQIRERMVHHHPMHNRDSLLKSIAGRKKYYEERRVKITCPNCGKERLIKPSRLRKYEKQFCNSDCYAEWRSKHLCNVANPNWRGGVSFEPYCPRFTKRFRERVRAFWGYQCPSCGRTQSENRRMLSVHHVTFNKKICCEPEADVALMIKLGVPEEFWAMFIPLCGICHAKTLRGDREYWKAYYIRNIVEHTGGKSWFTEEEYKEYLKGLRSSV